MVATGHGVPAAAAVAAPPPPTTARHSHARTFYVTSQVRHASGAGFEQAGTHALRCARARRTCVRYLCWRAKSRLRARADGARAPADRVLAAEALEGWIVWPACGCARWLRRVLAIGGGDARARVIVVGGVCGRGVRGADGARSGDGD